MFVRQCKSFLLERDGYIRTLPALGTKCRNSLGKTADVGTNALIFDGRAFLQRKLLMDLRRFTVCNGVAENGVTRSDFYHFIFQKWGNHFITAGLKMETLNLNFDCNFVR